MSWSVVVPTNRPDRFKSFTEAWTPLFQKHDVALFVVQDSEPWDFDYSGFIATADSWPFPDFIPSKTDMCRSLGIHRAWKAGTTYTLSLDDDVLPEGDIFDEYERVFEAGAPCSEYLSVGSLTSYGGQLRGFPFADRSPADVAIQYGGWNGVLDYDAPTQLAGVRGSEGFSPVVLPVPRGAAVTTCIMNAAWRTEYAPIMWQLPLLDGRFNRFGDIWSGLFQKRVLDALGKVMVINGKASVRHERASDPLANLEREAPGIPLNEEVWSFLAESVRRLDGGEHKSMVDAFKCVTEWAYFYFGRKDDLDYAEHFCKCRDEWLALFS